MTQYIYIASPTRLAKGTFGLKPQSAEESHVYNTTLDATALHFESNYDSERKRRFSFSPHFSFYHQVAVSSNHLPLKYQLKGTPEEEKCLAILYSYLEKALETSSVLEYFTSLSGKEELAVSKKRKISWSDIKDPYDLVLKDREFWEITF